MDAFTGKSKDELTRRKFLTATSALGVSACFGLPRAASAEPQPEIKKLRLPPCTGTLPGATVYGGGLAAPGRIHGHRVR